VPQGKVVQLDPFKPTLKAPEAKRLKLECDDLISSFAFNFKSRRYNKAAVVGDTVGDPFKVGLCGLTLSNPR